MRPDDAVTYERFLAARMTAIEVTDSYNEAALDDPERPALWERVVRQTDAARALLDAWLRGGSPHEWSEPLRRAAADRAEPPAR